MAAGVDPHLIPLEQQASVKRLFWPRITKAPRSHAVLFGLTYGSDVLVTRIVSTAHDLPPTPTADETMLGTWQLSSTASTQQHQIICFGKAVIHGLHSELPACIQIRLAQVPADVDRPCLTQLFLYSHQDWMHVPASLQPTSQQSFSTSLQLLTEHHLQTLRHPDTCYITCCNLASTSSHINTTSAPTQQPAPTQTLPRTTSSSTHTNCLLIPPSFIKACSVVQRILGLYLGLLILRHWTQLIHLIEVAAVQVRATAVEHVHWFMTAHPAGIKLHAELCHLMGMVSLTWVTWISRAASMTHPWCAHLALTWTLTASLLSGATGTAASVQVLLLGITAPVAALHAAVACLYRWQLYGIRLTWRMMRSKFRSSRAARSSASTSTRQGVAGHGQQQSAPEQPQLPPTSELDRADAQVTQDAHAAVQSRGPVTRSAARQGCSTGSKHTEDSAAQCRHSQGHVTGSEAAAGQQAAAAGSSVAATQQQAAGAAKQDGKMLWGEGQKGPHEVVPEELFVGVLLFLPLAMLLPTTLAWHLLICAAHLPVLCMCMGLKAVEVAFKVNPVLLMVWALLWPDSFPGGVSLDTVGRGPQDWSQVQVELSSGDASAEHGLSPTAAPLQRQLRSSRKLRHKVDEAEGSDKDGYDESSSSCKHATVRLYSVWRKQRGVGDLVENWMVCAMHRCGSEKSDGRGDVARVGSQGADGGPSPPSPPSAGKAPRRRSLILMLICGNAIRLQLWTNMLRLGPMDVSRT